MGKTFGSGCILQALNVVMEYTEGNNVFFFFFLSIYLFVSLHLWECMCVCAIMLVVCLCLSLHDFLTRTGLCTTSCP